MINGAYIAVAGAILFRSLRTKMLAAERSSRAYQVAASNGSIAEGADQTRKRNRKAVRDDRWNAHNTLQTNRI
jgi:hypothetical protein